MIGWRKRIWLICCDRKKACLRFPFSYVWASLTEKVWHLLVRPKSSLMQDSLSASPRLQMRDLSADKLWMNSILNMNDKSLFSKKPTFPVFVYQNRIIPIVFILVEHELIQELETWELKSFMPKLEWGLREIYCAQSRENFKYLKPAAKINIHNTDKSDSPWPWISLYYNTLFDL